MVIDNENSTGSTWPVCYVWFQMLTPARPQDDNPLSQNWEWARIGRYWVVYHDNPFPDLLFMMRSHADLKKF